MTTSDHSPLLVRLPNALGDLVMVQPALAFLASAGHRVIALGLESARLVHHDQPWRSEPLPPTRKGYRALRARGARHALLLRSSFRSIAELRATGARTIGFRADLRSWWLWRGLDRPRGRHKVEEYHHLARCTDAWVRGERLPALATPVPPPEIRAAAAALEQGQAALARAGVPPRFVVCCPTVSLRHRADWKVWPGFAELYRWLEARRIVAVTCPGLGEEARCANAGARGVILPALSVPALIGVLAQATIVVSNDTGQMHLAHALGVPTIGLFGNTSPVRYAPYGPGGRVLGELGRWPLVDAVATQVTRLWDEEHRARDTFL